VPHRYLRHTPQPPGELGADFVRIRAEFEVAVEFPPEVEAEARLSAWSPDGRADRTSIELVTVDPPGSRDLDQAMHLDRIGGGFRVHYAIADVGALVAPGGAVEAEAWRRGVTVYCPDRRATLYPSSICEGSASLLPDQDRPAVLFTIDLDERGRQTGVDVERAVVRSRAQLTYATAHIPLLRTIGTLRKALARERGAVQLPSPAQIVVADPAVPCGYRLELEPRLPIEDWNAEISLLTGMAAAGLMCRAGLGLLRTMSGLDEYRLARFRRVAAALSVPWPPGVPYPEFVSGLDPGDPHQAALLQEARGVMGRAGYLFFEGDPPDGSVHAAIAAPYAHTTAPLRRLADRHVLELLAGHGDPATLSRLPEVMEAAQATAGQVERAIIDAMETRVLEHRVGETFAAVALENDARGTIIQIGDPPIRARLKQQPPPPPGERVDVRLVRADPASRSLEFRPAA
jgi:exoribonuclease R